MYENLKSYLRAHEMLSERFARTGSFTSAEFEEFRASTYCIPSLEVCRRDGLIIMVRQEIFPVHTEVDNCTVLDRWGRVVAENITYQGVVDGKRNHYIVDANYVSKVKSKAYAELGEIFSHY